MYTKNEIVGLLPRIKVSIYYRLSGDMFTGDGSPMGFLLCLYKMYTFFGLGINISFSLKIFKLLTTRTYITAVCLYTKKKLL